MPGEIEHPASLAELQALQSRATYVAVDFYADWCPPCKQIAPIWSKIAQESTVPGQLEFAKVNVDHAQDVAREYGISAMPTFMFFKNGKQVAVHGQAKIQGADVRAVKAAVDKLSGLAKSKAAEAGMA